MLKNNSPFQRFVGIVSIYLMTSIEPSGIISTSITVVTTGSTVSPVETGDETDLHRGHALESARDPP